MFHEFNFCVFVLPMFRQVFNTYSLIQCREIMFLLRELYACQHCVLLVMWMVSKIKTSMTRVIVHPKLLYLFKSCTHCAVLVTILRLQLSEKNSCLTLKEMMFSIHSASVPAHLLSNRQLLSLLLDN